MSIATDEKLMPVGDAFFELIGYRPAHQTISRLVRTRKIKASKMLGAWYCTLTDLRDYMARTTEDAMSNGLPQPAAAAPRSRTESARIRAQKEATDFLEANGIV